MEENWKVVRNRSCIRALMIFIGVILMQMLAYMICMIALLVGAMIFGEGNLTALEHLAKANTQDSAFRIWLSLVSAMLSMIWCAILYRKSSWRERPFDYKKAFRSKNILAIFGSGIGGCIVLTMLLSGLSVLLPDVFIAYNNSMKNLTDSSMAVTVVYVLLIGPVSEEFIFRGAILDRFYLAFPFWAANILQAALFGIYHANLIQGLYAFCLGLVLGLIRYLTGSMLGSILTHILFNATTYLLGYVMLAAQEIQVLLLSFITVCGIAACIWSVRYLIMEYRRREGNSQH